MKKKLIAALLAATVAVGAMPSAGALLDGFTASRTYSNQFTDVPTNAWYYNSVKSAYNLGLVNGSSATTYSPNKMKLPLRSCTLWLLVFMRPYYGKKFSR